MANLIFKKKKLNPKFPIYEIELNGPAIEKTQIGNEVTFKRAGPDKNWGFSITFVGTNPPPIITVPPSANTGDESRIDWPVPDKVGTFKYIVSFPHDNTQKEPDTDENQIVVPLDPVIIINPRYNALVWIKPIALVLLGAALTYVGLRLF